MIKIANVLCTIDFSAFSVHALAHSVQIGRWFNSTVTALYVYPPPVPPPPMLFAGMPGPVPPEPFPAQTVSPDLTHDQMTAELTKFVAANVDSRGVQVRVHVRAGDVVREILNETQALADPLIVLGTHGHTGFDRLVLGSVTEKVLRKAPCPVLTVPPAAADPAPGTPPTFKRILCPIDFSEASLRGLEYALALAQEADADLLLLHVIEGLPEAPNWQQADNPAVREYLHLSEEQALSRLRRVLPEEARTWCRPQELLMTGKPYDAILRVAREQNVHLIVMGVHGRNPIDVMFFGSTTNHVIRTATCPVLTLRH